MISSNIISSRKSPVLILFMAIAVSSICFLNVFCEAKKQVESSKRTISSRNGNTIKTVSINKDLLMGIWGTTPTENASFQILQDSIYYVDANSRLKYDISGNMFICYDEKGDTNFICSVNKLDKDSLVMENNRTNEKSGFIRLH